MKYMESPIKETKAREILTLDFAKSQWQICRINHNDENQKTIEEFDFSNTNDVVFLEKFSMKIFTISNLSQCRQRFQFDWSKSKQNWVHKCFSVDLTEKSAVSRKIAIIADLDKIIVLHYWQLLTD